MRKIKFRGKDQADIWHFGDLLHGENAIFIDDTYSEILSLISPTKVLAETVGQFTGLLDRNGEEIYEGDIIHLKDKEYDEDWGVVTWHGNGYFYLDDTFGKRKKDCVKPIGDFFDAICDRTQITVSGNIHDKGVK